MRHRPTLDVSLPTNGDAFQDNQVDLLDLNLTFIAFAQVGDL